MFHSRKILRPRSIGQSRSHRYHFSQRLKTSESGACFVFVRSHDSRNMFLEVDVFKKKYRFGDKISQGGYGIVYDSDNYVVKVQDTFGSTGATGKKNTFSGAIIEAVIREIDFYSRIDHPCIIKLVDWSMEIITGTKIISYMALPKGESILSAYKAGKISIDDICQDLLSAIAFLHSNYICHQDIKPLNVVFLDGHAVLIDFGIAKNTKPVDDYALTTGVAFTRPFKDPEYYQGENNKDTCDEYAFGVTIYCISKGIFYIKDGINSTYPYPYIIGYNLEDLGLEIIKDCLQPVERRPQAGELLKKYGYEYIQGSILETEIPRYGELCTEKVQKIFNNILNWSFGVFTSYNFNIKSFFLFSHLFYRTLKIVVPDFLANDEELLLLTVCCMYLTSIVEEDKFGVEHIISLLYGLGYAYDEKDIFKMIEKIMISMDGIIVTETYWFYARNCDDILAYLIEVFNCNYDLNKIKFYDMKIGSNKDKSCNEIVGNIKIFSGFPVTRYSLRYSFPVLKRHLIPETDEYLVNERIIVPASSKFLQVDIKEIEEDVLKCANLLKDETSEDEQMFGLINRATHYAKYFKFFTPEGGYKIYNDLCAWKNTKTVLRWYYKSYLGFENIDDMPRFKFLNVNFNPFNVSSMQELIDNNFSDVPPISSLSLAD